MRSPGEPTEDERRRLWGAADAAASVREHLLARKPLEASDFSATQTPSPRVPVLREIERTLGLLPHAFGGAGQAAMDLPPTVEEKTKRTLPWVEDAFTNREHLKFSLKGTLPPMTWDLINLSDSRVQMSMAIARDRVVGTALGLLCMWIFYEQPWPVNAARQMLDVFASNLELLAQLAVVDRDGVNRDGVIRAIGISVTG